LETERTPQQPAGISRPYREGEKRKKANAEKRRFCGAFLTDRAAFFLQENGENV